jgi:hypothetical protein
LFFVKPIQKKKELHSYFQSINIFAIIISISQEIYPFNFMYFFVKIPKTKKESEIERRKFLGHSPSRQSLDPRWGCGDQNFHFIYIKDKPIFLNSILSALSTEYTWIRLPISMLFLTLYGTLKIFIADSQIQIHIHNYIISSPKLIILSFFSLLLLGRACCNLPYWITLDNNIISARDYASKTIHVITLTPFRG